MGKARYASKAKEEVKMKWLLVLAITQITHWGPQYTALDSIETESQEKCEELLKKIKKAHPGIDGHCMEK